MGRMKEWLMEQQERGYYHVGDKYVCKECFYDDAIQRFIEQHATEKGCDYCGKTSRKEIAASIDEVLGLIVESVEYEWGDPNNEGVPYETAEDGWQGDVIDSWDLLFEKIGLPTDRKQLQEDIHRSISDRQWCRRNFYGFSPHDALIYSWDEFARQVKHETRYVFFRYVHPSTSLEDAELVPPSRMLDELSKVFRDTALFKQ